jgi:hypothetical protein
MATKKRPYLNLIVIVLLLAISSGCYTQSNPEQTTEAPLASQTPTRFITYIPVITDTPLIPPTETSPTIYATETSKPKATMTDLDRKMFVQSFLETNENCRLPCLWETIPGETSWMDVETRLRHMGLEFIGTSSLESGNTYHGLGGFDLLNKHIFNSFSFVERNGVVMAMHLISEGYANPEYFQGQWRDYSPKQIMSTYGKPSRVWLKTQEKTIGDRHSYDLWLVYDDYGFIIQYVGFLENKGQILHICPRFEGGMDIMWLQIYIHAPDDLTPSENMGGLVSPEPQAGKKSIEDATGLSVDDFYELFHQNQELACFDTPSDIWE